MNADNMFGVRHGGYTASHPICEEPPVSYPPEHDNPFAMSPDEVFRFLEERRFATVSTLRKTGAPLNIVLGYEWDGSSMFLSMRSTRAIVKRLERDPRVCITVHSNEYPPKYVSSSRAWPRSWMTRGSNAPRGRRCATWRRIRRP